MQRAFEPTLVEAAGVVTAFALGTMLTPPPRACSCGRAAPAPGASPARVRHWHTRCPPMHERNPLRGELQIQIMAALWRLGSGTVEDVRTAIAPRRNAYTTVQTVLNRLAERRLVTRERHGRAYVYRPKLSEADYVARSIRRALAGASGTARKTALAQLIAGLDESELAQLQEMARRSGRP